MAHHRHSYRNIALGTAIILCLLPALHLMLPYVVNIQVVRDRIMAQASGAISGKIVFGTIKPVLLPVPHVMANQVRITLPDKLNVRIPKLIFYPKIGPLLSGTLELDRLKLIDPEVLLLRPLPKARPQQFSNSFSMPTIQDYLSETLVQFVGGLGHFNAKTIGGRVIVEQDGRKQIVLSDLHSRFGTAKRQLHIHLRGNSRLAGRLDLEGDIDLDTLNSIGRLQLIGLNNEIFKALGVAPIGDRISQTDMDLDVAFRSNGLETIHARFSAQTPAVSIVSDTRRLVVENLRLEGHVDWSPQQTKIAISKLQTTSPRIQLTGAINWSKTPLPPAMPIQISFNGAEVDVPQIRSALMQLYGDHPVVRKVLDIVRGGTVPWLTGSVAAVDWSDRKMMDRLRVEFDLVDGHIRIPKDLLDLKDVNGRVLIAKGRLLAHGASARLGNSSAKKGALVLGLYDRSRAFDMDALVNADLAQLRAVLRRLITAKNHLALLDQLPLVTGRVSGRLKLGDRLDRITAQITAASHIKTEDSEFELIGTINDLPGPETSVRVFTKGQLGAKAVDWLWRAAKAAPEFMLETPFFISGADINWRPSGQLALNGRLKRDHGLTATADLTAQKDDFHLKRLHVKGQGSDALISFRSQKAGQVLDAGLTGYVEKAAVDQLFRENRHLVGWLKGRMQAHIDQRELERTALDGQLSVYQLHIPLGGSSSLQVLKASVQGVNGGFAVPSLSLRWDDQAMQLSGTGVFTRDALDLEMTLNADALDGSKFIPMFKVGKPGATDRSANPKPVIRIRGKAMVAIDQLDYGRYRIAPFRAAIEHGESQSLVNISAADMCGIQIPGRILFLADGTLKMTLQPKVTRSELKSADSCLLDAQHTERLEGIVDLTGKISTHGRSNDELISNLRGDVDLQIEKGRIYNVGSAGLFTNLLSYLSVNQYLSGELPDLRQNDFHYNRIDSQLVFRDGLMIIKEGMVKSNSVNMVADGQYHLSSKDLDLKVLVSPLTTVDWIVERIPIVGNILGGTLVAIPVSVKGHQSDPKVTPLALSAVGSRLGGILKRAVNTPVRIIEPLLKDDTAKKPSQHQ
jgi:hypothetical protein